MGLSVQHCMEHVFCPVHAIYRIELHGRYAPLSRSALGIWKEAGTCPGPQVVSADVTWDFGAFFTSSPPSSRARHTCCCMFSQGVTCHLNSLPLTLVSVLKEMAVQGRGWGLTSSSTQPVALGVLTLCHHGVDSDPGSSSSS